MLERERHVAEPRGVQLLDLALGLRGVLAHLRGQETEPLLGHRGEKRLLVREVAIGRGMADARAAGHLAQGEGVRTLLRQQRPRSLEQGLPE